MSTTPLPEQYLDFEKPILEIINRIKELDALLAEGNTLVPEKNLSEEKQQLEIKEKAVTRRLYRHLTPWQKVQVARHPNRPHAEDFISALIEDFVPLAGDRRFGDDAAMVAGLGTFQGKPVCVLGTEKGRTTKDRVRCGFGMPRPEGYRKAQRIMEMAHKFNLPLLTFVDTPGAFPGVEAEARGQAEAIAMCLEKLLSVNIPVISLITGEGGSGGALAVAVADRVLMLEHSVYSVISPEGCAAILWRDASEAPQAAEALKMTAEDLQALGVSDGIIKEPVGGAHRDWSLTMRRTREALHAVLLDVIATKSGTPAARRQKFLALTGATPAAAHSAKKAG